jgi:zinc transport system ATP-binding protein
MLPNVSLQQRIAVLMCQQVIEVIMIAEQRVIDIAHVHFAYESVPVLTDVTLQVQVGEFIGLVGPNGGGKSTLLKLMLGLIKPDSGQVHILGRPPNAVSQRIGYVPQYPKFPRDFPICVRDVVLMGCLGKHGWFKFNRKQALTTVRRVLIDVAAQDLEQRLIGTLSGGQLQRVLLARALATEPRLLLLDEPTANMDQHIEGELFELLAQLNSRLTIVVVSHDIAFISRYINRVACLNRTLVCHTTSCIDGQAVHTLYGQTVGHIMHHQRSL